jgi:hypothetical protein
VAEKCVVDLKAAATLLSGWARLPDVAPADVRELVERGMLPAFGFRGCPTVELEVPARWVRHGVSRWDVPPPPAAVVEELRRLGEERRAWRVASMDRYDAAEELGLSLRDFDLLAAGHGVQPGRFGRYARSDVARLRRAGLERVG